MEIRFKVIVNNKRVSLQDAFAQGYIQLEQDGINAASGVLLQISTNVYDKYNREIFFEDELYDDNDNRYIVKNLYGTAYIYKFLYGELSFFSTLSSMQFKQKIDLIKR